MGGAAKNREALAFAGILGRIKDERVRYFYMMLGDALAEATAGNLEKSPGQFQSNTGQAQIEDIAVRINRN